MGKDQWTAYLASAACRHNAEALVDDARTLVRHGSYGHAAALLVLAEEELGKGFMWTLAAIGIPIPRSLLRGHMEKQLMEVATLLSQELFLQDFPSVLDRVARGKAPGAAAEEVARYLDALKGKIREAATTSAKPRIEAEARRVGGLNRRKALGFYVDVRGDGRVLVPQDTSKDEAQEYLSLVRRRLGLVRPLPEFTEKRLEEAVNIVAPVVDSFKDDIRERLLEMDRSSRRRPEYRQGRDGSEPVR